MTRLTKRRAIQILIRHAAANMAGVGRGMRAELTSAEQSLVAQAIKRVWGLAYAHKLTESDYRNLGLQCIVCGVCNQVMIEIMPGKWQHDGECSEADELTT